MNGEGLMLAARIHGFGYGFSSVWGFYLGSQLPFL